VPGIDGAELFGKIRAIKPELPITVITGYPESELMMKALNYGPLGIMKKPFKNTDVLTAVTNYLHPRTSVSQFSQKNIVVKNNIRHLH